MLTGVQQEVDISSNQFPFQCQATWLLHRSAARLRQRTEKIRARGSLHFQAESVIILFS